MDHETRIFVTSLARLSGPDRAAFRRRGSRKWTVVEADRLPDMGLPVGLHMVLARKDSERADDPMVTDVSPGVFLPALPGLPLAAVWLLGVVAIGVGGWGAMSGYADGLAFKINPVRTWIDLGIASGSLAIAFLACVMLEASILAGHVSGNVSMWGLRRGIPVVEAVAWRLSIRTIAAVAVLSGPAALVAAAAGLYGLAPQIAFGAMSGAAIFMLARLFPLHPGPGARILETMTRIPDLPRVLHWAIVRHYLALRMQEDSDEHTGRRGIAAGIFAAWLAAFGFLFYGLAGPLFAANGPGAAVWKAIFSVAGLFYAAWLISVFVGLARTASRLREGSHLNQIVPAADLIEYWKAQCGLIRHVPRLLDAQWTWSSVPAGSYLIRYGNTDRTFFWLAEGRTRVIAHPPGSEPMHVATLGAGTGVGEISLLDNEPRTADVIVEEAAIVATLSRDALDAVADEATYDRFRDVVLAGQALSRSTVFHGLPDADRERWIAYGTPRRYDTGEPVILQGAVESWVGLVVSGTVVVERGEQTIAVLGHDEVFGEIAYLTDAPRNASIRATDSLLVWRWDKNWLDAELMRGGVGDALLKLAVERQNIQ